MFLLQILSTSLLTGSLTLLCHKMHILEKLLYSYGIFLRLTVLRLAYCVPGTVENVSLIRDVLEVSGSLGFDAGMVSLDQEKLFDRAEHCYL